MAYASLEEIPLNQILVHIREQDPVYKKIAEEQ